MDNASYNDLAVRLLQDSLSSHRSFCLKGQLFHVRCCAHILNLLVQDGLSEVQHIIENVRESVKYISASAQRLNSFSEIAKQLQLSNKKLILDCSTRWNATYAMLSTALEFKVVFPRYGQGDSGYKYLPSEDDWVRVEEVCSFLALFNEVANIISGSEYPTLNLFLPELWSIKELLDDKSDSEVPWLSLMAMKMKKKFDKYWGECKLLISIGAVLDPRFKMKLIEFAFGFIYSEEEAPKQINLVRNSLYDLYNEYLDEHKASIADISMQDVVQSSDATNKDPTPRLLSGRLKYEKYIRSVYTVQNVKSELDTYLEEGVFICEENSGHFDALEWWKSNNLKFRILSKMACAILSIPITTVTSESTFNTGGREIDAYRSSLGTDTVQMLLCGGNWFQNFYGITRKTKSEEDVEEISLPCGMGSRKRAHDEWDSCR